MNYHHGSDNPITWSSVCFILVVVELASGIGASQATLDDTQKTTGERTNKLALKQSVTPPKYNADSCFSLIKKAPVAYNMVQKRWLSESFGFRQKKKQQKESRKWLIEDQLSVLNSPPSTQVIQNPWMELNKRKQAHQEGHLTDFKPNRKVPAGARVSARKQSFHKKIPMQQKHIDNIPKLNVDNTLFRYHHNEGNNVGSLAVLQPEHRSKTYGYPNDLPPLVNTQVWKKSDDPTWGRYMTSFEKLKFNPLKNQYLFHEGSSSIKGYTTPNYGWAQTSEPPLKSELIQNDDSFSLAMEPGNSDVIMESKVVADSKAKSKLRKYELVPKIYALKNEKTKNQNNNDRYGWSTKMGPNPIVVPGFKRKHTEAPSDHDEQVSRRPYIIHAEDRKASFDDDFVQVSRGDRNLTKNMASIKDNTGVPAQQLPPYAFPGGVNISILVPNPAAAFHETPPSTMTSTSTNKYGKKKKERKSKGKPDYDPLKDLLSETRSLASAGNRKLHVEEQGIKSFSGEDDRKITVQQPIRPQLNNLIGNVKQPMFNLKPENFSLLSQINNLTLNQLDWESPLFGIQTEKIEKPSDYSEDEDNNDEIGMLYDEQTSTTLRSDENAPIGQTASLPWYRFTDYSAKKSSARDVWQTGKYCTPINVEPALGIGWGGSGRVNPGIAKYLNEEPRSIDSGNVASKQSFRRSGTKGRNGERESEAIPSDNFTFRRHHESGYLNDKSRGSVPRDQWDALDEALKSDIGGKVQDVAWQARNRKREVDYENQLANDDEQGYYRLSLGGNSFRNPANLVMSVFRANPNKHRARDYYDDIPEEPIGERMRSNIVGSPHH